MLWVELAHETWGPILSMLCHVRGPAEWCLPAKDTYHNHLNLKNKNDRCRISIYMIFYGFMRVSIKMDMTKSITNLRLKFAATWFAKHVGMLCKIFIGTRANMHQWLVFTGSLDSQNPQAFKDKQPCIPWSSSFLIPPSGPSQTIIWHKIPHPNRSHVQTALHMHTWSYMVHVGGNCSRSFQD